MLVVDDDPCICEDLQHRLSSLSYDVVATVPSAEEAIEIATKQAPGVVLMDIHCAGQIDGIEAAKQLKTIETSLIFVTGQSSQAVFKRAIETEPAGYVLKPYETADLQIAIEVALQKRRGELEQRHLVHRLQSVLAEAKILTGMLSICAYCKRVKDQAGDWPQIESYIMQHSHATFSHGMCPECFNRVKSQLQALESGTAGSPALVLG